MQVKPLLRGALHQHAISASLAAGALLVATAHGRRAKLSCAVKSKPSCVRVGASTGHHVSFVRVFSGLRGLGMVDQVYVASLAALFTASAAYHRPTWSAPARAVMRKLDHASIFLLIAGVYAARP